MTKPDTDHHDAVMADINGFIREGLMPSIDEFTGRSGHDEGMVLHQLLILCTSLLYQKGMSPGLLKHILETAIEQTQTEMTKRGIKPNDDLSTLFAEGREVLE